MDNILLALDIGGNWGQSIFALQRLAKPTTIISFEPNPVLCKNLSRVFRSHKNVRIEPFALGDELSTMTLHVPRYNNFVYDGLASLNREEAASWLSTERMLAFDRSRLHIDTYEVGVKTLDSYNLSPDIVKIDVQGFEEHVIKGALETFRRSFPVVLVEAPNEQVITILRQLGFDPYRYWAGMLKKGDCNGKNVFFMTAKRRAALRL
jgi:FkbM family methyltransferase